MKTQIIAFTGRGAALAARLCDELETAAAWSPQKYCTGSVRPLTQSLADWTRQRFETGSALIFIGGSGIAIRAIAPHVRSKDTDPAVLCIDEAARFVIPLLSGHLGGANRLARELAVRLGSQPVITTATDVNGIFSPDDWAAQHDCAVADIGEIKHISAALLDHEPVGFCSEFPLDTPLPQGVIHTLGTSCGIELGFIATNPYPHTLHLIPRCVVVGIGCRRDTAVETLERRLLADLDTLGLPLKSVGAVASIDLKADEPGLLELCRGLNVPLQTYTAAELMAAPGEFTPSSRVERVTGTDNVCERAAVLAGGEIISRKTAYDGVTVAVARKNYIISFEGATK